MKLPLITRLRTESRVVIFHVLALEDNYAIGVNDKTLKIERIPFSNLDVLSEEEYQQWKEKQL